MELWGRKSDLVGSQREAMQRKWRKLVETTPLKSLDEAEEKWDNGNQKVLTVSGFYTDITCNAEPSIWEKAGLLFP